MRALAAACAIVVIACRRQRRGAGAGPASAARGCPGLPADTPVQPYGMNDGGGFWNILPPGQNGHATAADIAAFFAACPPPKSNCPDAPRPKHSSKELQMYGDLVYASPGLRAADIPKYFKDATFGVKENEAERIYSPPGRDDVTIVRDSNFGVPHIYGKTRAGTMFGLGYVGAEDRLFTMDALRHAGRGELSTFAGGAAGNRAQDHTQWELAPYTEADLQRQYDLGDEVYGAAGAALQDDVTNYVAGINRYITEARVNPLKMPGEYAAIGKPGPEDWKVTDVIATASLIGGIFGKGGGRELDSALLLQDAQTRFGRKRGKGVWADLRSAEDPEAPVTVNRKRFPYRAEPKKLRKGGVVLPDRGSVRPLEVVKGDAAASASRPRGHRPRRAAGLPAPELERAARVRARVEVRHADRGDGPADGLLRPSAPDGRGRARTGDGRNRRHLRRDQPLRAARPRARLRVERHIGRPGHHRHVRGPALRAGRLRADDRLDALPVPRPVPADRGAREDEQLDSEPRGRHAARLRDAARRAHQARPGHRPRHEEGQAGGVHEAALHLLPRGGLGARVRGAERPEQDPRPARLPARRLQDRLHVQLVLRGPLAHRVLQLGEQPGARAAHELALPGELGLRVEGLEHRPVDREVRVVSVAPAGDRPAVPRQLEQQAGARHPRG